MQKLILSERYRPRTFDDFRGNADIVKVLSARCENGGLSGRCLLLWGPSGVGKTTLARIIGHRLAGHEFNYLSRTGQGVSVAWLRGCGSDDFNDFINRCGWDGGFKVVVIEEIQQTPPAAKDALKDALENIPGGSLVIATTTGKPDKIFDAALKNRFQLRFRLKRPQIPELNRYLEIISEAEGVPLNGKIKTIARRAYDEGGNFRQAINEFETIDEFVL